VKVPPISTPMRTPLLWITPSTSPRNCGGTVPTAFRA
jgi:hypothetical protein